MNKEGSFVLILSFVLGVLGVVSIPWSSLVWFCVFVFPFPSISSWLFFKWPPVRLF